MTDLEDVARLSVILDMKEHELKAARRNLAQAARKAKRSHTYQEIADAAKTSIPSIQRLLELRT